MIGPHETQAKRAIDALAAVIPLLEEEALKRDLGAALANLQVAFADAARSNP